MKTKRGDISTLILVLGVFLACVIAIFSFTIFNSANEEKFNVLGYMERVNFVAEQVRFYENIGEDPLDYLSIKSEGGTYYIITAEKKENNKTILYIEYNMTRKTLPSQ